MTWLMGSIRTRQCEWNWISLMTDISACPAETENDGFSSYLYNRVVLSFTADTPNQFVCGEFIGNWIGPSASTYIDNRSSSSSNIIIIFFLSSPFYSIRAAAGAAMDWKWISDAVAPLNRHSRERLSSRWKREKGRRDPPAYKRRSISTCIGYSAAAADGVYSHRTRSPTVGKCNKKSDRPESSCTAHNIKAKSNQKENL
jgi:hypothetical protein